PAAQRCETVLCLRLRKCWHGNLLLTDDSMATRFKNPAAHLTIRAAKTTPPGGGLPFPQKRKKIMPRFQPVKADQFVFGLWTIQNTGRDVFGEGTRAPLSGLEVIGELGRRSVYGFEMHAEDLVPAGSSAGERDRLLREARKMMADYDIKCTNTGAN